MAESLLTIAVGMAGTRPAQPAQADGDCTEPSTETIECEKTFSEELRIVPLHLCPELMETCADLINEEWKRSKASRIHSLQKSSNNFPVCLVLLRPLKIADGTGSKTKSQLVGHSKLSRVVGQASGLFVETVVVAKEYRGKGYGRKLMESTEAYAKFRGFKTLYLTTHDKQYFYFHLGYTLCKPVQNAGSMTTFVSMEMLERLSLTSTQPNTISSSPSKSIGRVIDCSGLVCSCSTTHCNPSNPSSSTLHGWTTLPPLPTPSLSQSLSFPSRPPLLPPSSLSPSLPRSLFSLSPENGLNHPSSSCLPSPPSQSHGSMVFPFSSPGSRSSQLHNQIQASNLCFTASSQLWKCPLPPPPPPPPSHIFSSQLHRPALSPNLYCLPLTPTFSPSQSHPLSSSLQLPNSLSDSITGLPAPPLLPELISTPSSQFPHSPEPSNIPGDINAPWRIEATQSLLETPYQDVKGLPVFWMKKNIYLIKSA
ncbi:wiskott-Aldrich syndrome protein family member 2-like [Callorhinchus milii]|uniref:wiskott-Aldrich syndrome protein family member 2-like n=1 Tax=Callorhinchus milii TaxID=7868 RepID=UPI0004575916|nr:wiskott-Aldrich syndrome protein family member 2-like [Callorhinchus milii]XP_042195532.1 wiskott-Aldrich syndrome protein family member 2-like [Callorhinchus milii]XP_042195533.1 wiskott-Aldrich syndrome protein family member 2-like [Callorhinchus milii]|eukprot:gi/632946170/ref/XP_007888426.1/ PREDICTED: N-acetyltransferase 6-like isoform X2 [Callorhinchus milii]